jgi:hypothetical protein
MLLIAGLPALLRRLPDTTALSPPTTFLALLERPG